MYSGEAFKEHMRSRERYQTGHNIVYLHMWATNVPDNHADGNHYRQKNYLTDTDSRVLRINFRCRYRFRGSGTYFSDADTDPGTWRSIFLITDADVGPRMNYF